jgi:hypothetical protein
VSYIVYDSGALIAAAKNNRRFMGRHAALLAADVQPLVPAGVLAQSWDPRPQAAMLHRLLRGCRVVPLTESLAKDSADLCHRNGSSDVVDASVVLASIGHGDAAIVTDDIGDIATLAAVAMRPHISVRHP